MDDRKSNFELIAGRSVLEGTRLLTVLDRIKRLLWQPDEYRAGEEIAFFEDDVDGLAMDYANLSKFAVTSDAGSLINYGERFRSGERTCCCRPERGRSMARSGRRSSTGIRGWPTIMK